MALVLFTLGGRGRSCCVQGPSSGSPWGRCDAAGPVQPWGPVAREQAEAVPGAGWVRGACDPDSGVAWLSSPAWPQGLCSEVEAWGPPVAFFKPHVSLSREWLVLLVVPRGPHPNAGLKQGWALMAIIPLMLGGSGQRLLLL